MAVTLDDLRSYQGRRVSVALADRSCLDDVVLEGVLDGDQRLWLHVGGMDLFIAVRDVLEVWAANVPAPRPGRLVDPRRRPSTRAPRPRSLRMPAG